jgi:DNA-binding beta-propeller fold protein YncE
MGARALPVTLAAVVAYVVMAAGCGAAAHRSAPRPGTPAGSRRAGGTVAHAAHRRLAAPEALVAAETINRVVAIDVGTGAARRSLPVPGGPQYIDADIDLALASSPQTGTVSILTGPRWRVRTVIHGFLSPHIVAISPDGDHAFVTDDRRGTLSVIRLTDNRVTSTLHVGAGAHHLAASPDQQQVWVALGESAHTIALVDTSRIDHPTLVGRLHPGFAAHDLAFSPDGRQVWITSAAGRDASVFDARDQRLLFRVPVGAPPQHVAFLGRSAYLTSGYGSTIERVASASGTLIRRAAVPYGSFELSAANGYVVTASLLNGRVAVFTAALRMLRVRTVAPETRDVAVVQPLGP